MPTLDLARLEQHRGRTFRLRADLRLQSRQDALDFTDATGFVYFWPIKDILYPSLWAAVAGNRPVADQHDDPGHVTWGWKDEMLGTRQWYYAKVLRGKATMISLPVVPYFYALSENYGEPEVDYQLAFEDGLLSREAMRLYETILALGPLSTVRIRREIGMTSKASNSSFERALVELQRDFKILPVGIAPDGAWRYSFIYEAVHRYYPALPEQARDIARGDARAYLLRRYFTAVGAAASADVRKLFQWSRRDTENTLARLAGEGIIVDGYQTQPDNRAVWVTAELADQGSSPGISS